MSDKNLSDAETRYRKFGKRSTITGRILSCIFAVIFVFVMIGFKMLAYSYLPLIIAGCLLLVFIMVFALVCVKMRAHSEELYREAYGERKEFERTGVFREIWNEYEYNKFEGIADHKTKCTYIDDHNNSIDMLLIRGRHEFNIEIDETGVYFLVDEETDDPVELTVKMSDIATLGDFYAIVTEFVLDHS